MCSAWQIGWVGVGIGWVGGFDSESRSNHGHYFLFLTLSFCLFGEISGRPRVSLDGCACAPQWSTFSTLTHGGRFFFLFFFIFFFFFSSSSLDLSPGDRHDNNRVYGYPRGRGYHGAHVFIICVFLMASVSRSIFR